MCFEHFIISCALSCMRLQYSLFQSVSGLTLLCRHLFRRQLNESDKARSLNKRLKVIWDWAFGSTFEKISVANIFQAFLTTFHWVIFEVVRVVLYLRKNCHMPKIKPTNQVKFFFNPWYPYHLFLWTYFCIV